MKNIITLFILFNIQCLFAQEGMWLPFLIEENLEQMQKQGFKLSAQDIYSENKTSMKDAVVLFNGGCTGEVISNEGLILTNHHCGFSAINALSTIENNYLKNGFWTYSKSQEIPAPGVTAAFIIRIEDVTKEILEGVENEADETVRNKKIKELITHIEKSATENTHYTAQVKSFYYDNQYILFVHEVFKDIRLVGTPPNAVGNFGGETDNWVWPRHTGDFSLFRIYANKENKPANYSSENIPYTPKYFFPISLNGIQENDFTMVYGFPGRTQEYLTSYAVDLMINQTNPNRIKCRDIRLEIIEKYMLGNDTITLQYASKVRSMANAHKKWKGEMIGLKANDAVEIKKEFERKFYAWTVSSQEGFPYTNLFNEFTKVYHDFAQYSELADFVSEAFLGVEVIDFSRNFTSLISKALSDTIPDSTIQKEALLLQKKAVAFYKNYNKKIDQEVFAELMKLYNSDVSSTLQAPYFIKASTPFKNNFDKWAQSIFAESIFDNQEKIIPLLFEFNKKKAQKLSQDPVYLLTSNVYSDYLIKNKEVIQPANENILRLMRKYMEAQMLMQPEKNFYPDANSTLRVTFGNVKGYEPKDGIFFTYQTTDDGIENKYIPNDEEFDVPEKLLSIFESDSFGRYADKNGNLPIAFIATNHTTGGNSGSPVLNASGALIGTNFDRVWEGTMSDIMYDINRCRNISLDIRYTLFIIEYFGKALNIIDELKIVY